MLNLIWPKSGLSELKKKTLFKSVKVGACIKAIETIAHMSMGAKYRFYFIKFRSQASQSIVVMSQIIHH